LVSQPGSESAQADAGSVVGTEEEQPAEARTPEAPAEGQRPWAVKRPWWLRRYTFTGTVVGLLFLWLSMTPSLLPRGPLFQGLVSGVSGAIGYAVGVFAVWLVRYIRAKDTSPGAPRIAWIVLVGAGAVGTVLMIVWFHIWQDDVRDLVGVPHLKWHDYPVAAVLAIVVLFALVEIGQLIRRLILFLVRRLNRVVPPRVSAVIAVLVVVAVIVGILNGVVLRLTMRTLNNTFETVNN
jgi:uncharacterized membrane protein